MGKILLAIALLLVASYAVLSQRSFVSSDNAVVSAYRVTVRAPIEGYLSSLEDGVGAQIPAQGGVGIQD